MGYFMRSLDSLQPLRSCSNDNGQGASAIIDHVEFSLTY